MSTIVLEGAHVVTVDPARAEYAGGHVVVTDNVITAVGPGRAPDDVVGGDQAVRRIDASGCLITPGFVNTHHHLYQWITRGLAVDATLFGWLTTLYPVWGRIDAELVHTAATGGLAWLAGTGLHHDHRPPLRLPPRRRRRARRGDRGRPAGRAALPPDPRVDGPGPEQRRAAAGQRGGGHRRDPRGHRVGDRHAPRRLVRLDAAHRGGAVLAVLGDRGPARSRRPTWPAARACGCTPTCARRSTRRSSARRSSAPRRSSTSSRWAGSGRTSGSRTPCTCPTRRSPGSPRPARRSRTARPPTRGSAPASAGRRDLRDAGVAVGLGVDGAASNEACSLLEEVRHALLFARARGGPEALTVRDALEMATMGGARVLGRDARDRFAGGGQARRHRRVAAGHARAHRHRRSGRRPGARRPAAARAAARQRARGGRAGPGDRGRRPLDTDALAPEVSAASRSLLSRAGGH